MTQGAGTRDPGRWTADGRGECGLVIVDSEVEFGDSDGRVAHANVRKADANKPRT